MGVLGNLGYNATSSPDFGSYGTPNAGVSSTGVLSSVASGAGLGASLGSFIPGIGTLAGAGVGALGGVLSSLIGKKSQDNTNKAQRQLAEYEFQKNLEMWNLSNEYNSPIRQLERLRAAGLNPNLVYGGNSVGNSSSEAPKYNAPQLKAYTDFSGVGNAATTALNVALAYNDLDMKKQQKRLLSNQADAMQIESLKKLADAADSYWSSARTKFDYHLAKSLKNNTIEAAEQNVRKIKQDIVESESRVDLNRLQKEIQEKTGLRLAEAQISNLRASAHLSYLHGSVIEWENQLRDQGINPNDPAAFRLAETIFGNIVDEIEGGFNKLSDWTQKHLGFRVFKYSEPGTTKKYILHGTK